jgi:tetratricopeptide (TPR) repeat protein/tRNA A-37 threonylcarbamoyl transferase component Bud32
MNPTIDILRAELERLYSLDEMTSMSQRLLGLDPEEVGGATAKASFARALTERCIDGDQLDALVDVILSSRQGVDPRVGDVASLLGREEIPNGGKLGPFVVLRKLGESRQSVVYAATRAARGSSATERRALKVLRHEACRDKRAVQRFLTANRMVAAIDHAGLPRNLEAGEHDGTYWVSYDLIDAQPLGARLARSGAMHIRDARPILRGILQPLGAMHRARIAHGDLKLENVLVGYGDGAPHVTLIDFGTDRLRHRAIVSNGHTGVLAVFGSPKTISPEQVRGHRASPATDLYAFGAMMYEMLTGKPVFTFETATDAAFAHVAEIPEAPSTKAPRGWVTPEIDEFVLSLLAKDPAQRPKDAIAAMDELESLGKASAAMKAPVGEFPEEKLTELVDLLIAGPEDEDAADALERAIEEGADPAAVAEAFDVAAKGVSGEDEESRAVKKSLLLRAARIFSESGRDRVGAERAYSEVVELDPDDVEAQTALDDVRKANGKYAEVVESLITRSESAAPGEERARIFSEIGRLCAGELEDPDQGILAYARALCEVPSDTSVAGEIERLAEGKPPLWNEVLATLTETIQGGDLSPKNRSTLLAYAARWYADELGRPDMAVHGYQQILAADPAYADAHEGLTGIFRKGQQWPELVTALAAYAEALGSAPHARDLRAEAGEVYEVHLNDTARAGDAYAKVLVDDPAHAKAGDGMARIAESTGDFETLAGILEQRAETARGKEKVEALLKIAELYEDQLGDLAEAESRFEAVLEASPDEPQALKGLDRIYNRTSKYRELLANLERQVATASTPRQKINLYERMAALHEEEFLDHAKAAECLEWILGHDPHNDGALTKLERHCRALGRWDHLQELYAKHARITEDPARKVELLMQQARVLADNIGSPEQAARVYERVLEEEPGHGAALESLAVLREKAGDARAALTAIEALAATAPTPEARAEQWVRAARLLESRGDRDGAIDRYKRAIEHNPSDVTTSTALRKAYAARGDAASVVRLLERELALADGDVARARLHGELARVLRDKLYADDEAERNAKRAIEIDPANADALLVLGDLAFEGERYVEATRSLEPLVGRASTLAKDDAVRALVRFIESYGRSAAALSSSPVFDGRQSAPPISESHPRVVTALQALEQIAPDDADALARVGRVMFESNNMVSAQQAFERLLARHGDELPRADRADAQWRLGEALRRLGELDAAVDLLREAADADPGNAAPLNALARVYEQTGDWEEFTRTKRRRLELAVGAERFELLLEIGDVEFKKLNSRGRAGKTYLAALEERPDDRKLLTKLMDLYSAEKDWGSLVEVVLRLVEFVDDNKQRAKYMHTAAMVTARQLGQIEDALLFYDKAIEFDPTLGKAMDEAIELRLQTGDHEGVERLLNVQLAQAKRLQDRDKIVAVLDRMGTLYRKLLNEPELAIDAYEAAQAFDPEGKERAEVLAELYASDVTQYLDKAVKAQTQMLRVNPYRVESYKLLRRLYTEARRPDPAWCLCQALSVLRLAETDEERFYLRYRGDNAAAAQAVLEEDDWVERIAHEGADPLVTRIFGLIQPTIIRARTQPLEAQGYSLDYRTDLASQPYAASQMLHYAQGVFGFESPPVFQNPDDPAGLGFVHAHVPSIVLGRAAFERVVPNQSLAFVAGRHLAYFRPGYYVRHLVPTGTGLKAWLFAAVRLCVPQFPIGPDLQGQVNEALAFMTPDFVGVQREILASTVSKLLQSGGAIDLKKWVSAVDLTADRAGFLLAHDLGVAVQVMRATEDAASVSSKERGKEIVLYSISEPYLKLREKLGITVDS